MTDVLKSFAVGFLALVALMWAVLAMGTLMAAVLPSGGTNLLTATWPLWLQIIGWAPFYAGVVVLVWKIGEDIRDNI